MADTYYGPLRPNWVSNTGVESLTSNMDFITITTGVDIRTTPAAAVVQTASTTGSSTTLAVASTTGITCGMAVTGTGVTAGCFVASITDSTHVVVSAAQTLTAVSVTFTPNNVACLNKLLEIVSLRGQPVIMGSPTGVSPTTLILATEHMGWSAVQGVSNVQLVDRIKADGINFGFNTDAALAVAFSTVLT